MGRRTALWFAWLALAAFLVLPGLWWEIAYFRSPGEHFYRAALLLIPLLLAGCALYSRLRGKRTRQWEIPALAMLCAAALMFYHPGAAFFGFALWLSCASAGLRIGSLLGLSLEDGAEVLALGFGFGCAALMLLLFGLGLAHALVPWLLVAILVLPVAIFRREAARVLAALARAVRSSGEWPGMESPVVGIAVVFACLLAACTVAVVVAPSVAYDPLDTHLAAAKFYAAQQALLPLPAAVYSYFPQGCEMLMAFGWKLGGQPAAQIVSPLSWAMLLMTVFALARECGLTRAAAFAGTVCAAALPFAHWTGSNAKNDALTGFFEAAALLALLRWVNSRQTAWLPAGALFLGAAFAIKHTALFGAVPLAFLLTAALLRSHAQPRTWLLAGTLFCAAGLYWHARTFALTGNPLYPSAAGQSVTVGIASPGATVQSRLERYAEVVWQTQFAGQVVFESPLPSPAGIVFIVFLPLAVFALAKPHRARAAVLVFAGVYFAYWLAVSGVIRYALLPFCLLAALLAGRAHPFCERLRTGAARLSVAAAFACVLLFSTLGIAIVEINGPMLMLLAKRIDAASYLRTVLPGYGALEWLNSRGAAEPVYGVQLASRVYAPDPGVFFFNSGPSVTAVVRSIRQHRPRYIILPENPAGAALETLLPGKPAAPSYRDAHFAVWEIAQHD